MEIVKQICVLFIIMPAFFADPFNVTVTRSRERKNNADILKVNNETVCGILNASWRKNECVCPKERTTFHLVDGNYRCFKKDEIVTDCSTTSQITFLSKISESDTSWKSAATDAPNLLGRKKGTYPCNRSAIWLDNLESNSLQVRIEYEITPKEKIKFNIYVFKYNDIKYMSRFNDIKGSVIKLVSLCNGVDICVLLKAKGQHTYLIPRKTSTLPRRTMPPQTKTKSKETTSKKTSSETTTSERTSSQTTTSERTPSQTTTSENTTSERTTPRGVFTNSLEANETSKTETNIIIGVVCSIVIFLILMITFIFIRLKHQREKKPPTAAMYATYEDVNPSVNTAYENPDSEYAYCEDVSIRNLASVLDAAKDNENTYKCLESEKNLGGEYAQLSLPETAVTGLSDPANEPVYLETEPDYATTYPVCFEAQPIYVETEPEYATTEAQYDVVKR
ncbi:uncharacterized protein LOC130624001 [Hydractinia symbiolongicarpus]|uniref:uncharacterized protein LOC130624001 n=1 Tax=Hydractinia symbiolongicarpus TaxID=13093 RepID=UPI00254BB9C3|nr:uncharacterized protein LOC130624001 [Hydractinia symbiolongicarpus]